jgi:benzodiazapine receptor
MIKNKYLSLVLILLITFIASAIGGFTTASFKEPWYSEIILPSFNAPSWIFPPIWTLLYILMSIAIWRIWVKFSDRKILVIYFYHLFFNATWSIVFFGFHQIELALLNLLIILLFIIILMMLYFKKDKISFYLMIPYILWALYAFILNLSIVILNN